MHALIDCGATGISFMDQDFARHHQIPLQELKGEKTSGSYQRKTIESGDITHIAKVGMRIQEHNDQLPMFHYEVGHYPIVLENSLATVT